MTLTAAKRRIRKCRTRPLKRRTITPELVPRLMRSCTYRDRYGMAFTESNRGSKVAVLRTNDIDHANQLGKSQLHFLEAVANVQRVSSSAHCRSRKQESTQSSSGGTII